MKLYSLQDNPACTGNVQICRYPAVTSLIWAVVCAAAAGGCFWLAEQGGYFQHGWTIPSGLLKYLGGLLVVGLLIAIWHLNKTRSPENWLLIIGDDGILVKFRSYLNSHFAKTDPVVVELRWMDIAWCRQTKETIVSPGSDVDTTRTTFYTYLDLKLRADELELLRTAMQTERNHKASTSGNSSVHHHHPVMLTENGILRLDWGRIYPRLGGVLKKLATKIPVESSVKLKPGDLSRLDGQDLEDLILNLAQKGETIQAVKMVRLKYDKSLTEAKEFVDELLVP